MSIHLISIRLVLTKFLMEQSYTTVPYCAVHAAKISVNIKVYHCVLTWLIIAFLMSCIMHRNKGRPQGAPICHMIISKSKCSNCLLACACLDGSARLLTDPLYSGSSTIFKTSLLQEVEPLFSKRWSDLSDDE